MRMNVLRQEALFENWHFNSFNLSRGVFSFKKSTEKVNFGPGLYQRHKKQKVSKMNSKANATPIFSSNHLVN